jgi:hypothetical protein
MKGERMKNEGIVATIDITREQWDQLDSWARLQHVPLQTLINTVFAAGLTIFKLADAEPEKVKVILESTKAATEEGDKAVKAILDDIRLREKQ